MLAGLSVKFVILNAPRHVTRLWFTFRISEITFADRFLQTVVQFVYYLNFAVKFMLFFSGSKNFRNSFIACLPIKTTRGDNSFKSQTENTQTLLEH